jgi:hypothetical protein
MQTAQETLDHFPSIAQLEQLAKEKGFLQTSGWKYFTVPDCMACGGVGWHYVFRMDKQEAVVACDDCGAGRNHQKGPKGTITFTMKQIPGCQYSRPGR